MSTRNYGIARNRFDVSSASNVERHKSRVLGLRSSQPMFNVRVAAFGGAWRGLGVPGGAGLGVLLHVLHALPVHSATAHYLSRPTSGVSGGGAESLCGRRW